MRTSRDSPYDTNRPNAAERTRRREQRAVRRNNVTRGVQNSNKEAAAPGATKTTHGRGFPISKLRMSTRLELAMDSPLPGRDVMERNSWNPEDRSLNIYVKEDDLLTLHRHPVAQSTDCIRYSQFHNSLPEYCHPLLIHYSFTVYSTCTVYLPEIYWYDLYTTSQTAFH